MASPVKCYLNFKSDIHHFAKREGLTWDKCMTKPVVSGISGVFSSSALCQTALNCGWIEAVQIHSTAAANHHRLDLVQTNQNCCLLLFFHFLFIPSFS